MKKQHLLETRKHGTPCFPMECFENHCKTPGTFIPLHWHTSIEILHFIHGTAEITIGSIPFHPKPGDIFCVNQEELHRITTLDNDLLYQTFIFSLQSLQFSYADNAQSHLMPLLQNIIRFPTHINEPFLLQSLSPILTNILHVVQQKLPGYELMAKSLVLQFIATLIANNAMVPAGNSPSEKSLRIKHILEFLKTNYATNLSIHSMAQTFHMSPKYFSRYFTTATGQNFTAYLNTIRIEKACEFLQETDFSILEIAFECGYDNISYFNRVFRNQMHTSPSKFRKLYG